jgi:orotate phosphoribosyltransferase
MGPDSFWHHVERRDGHFLFESGHHGDLWLTLGTLCADPASLAPCISRLASLVTSDTGRPRPGPSVDVICGPLIEGAFVGLGVARGLGLLFAYSVPTPQDRGGALFAYDYEIPSGLRGMRRGKRVALVNDFINAGSALRGTLRSLESIGSRVEVIACLATLGQAAEGDREGFESTPCTSGNGREPDMVASRVPFVPSGTTSFRSGSIRPTRTLNPARC